MIVDAAAWSYSSLKIDDHENDPITYSDLDGEMPGEFILSSTAVGLYFLPVSSFFVKLILDQSMRCCLLLLLGCMPFVSAWAEPQKSMRYYKKTLYGSESLYSPLSAFVAYSLDTLQLPENFNVDNFGDNLNLTLSHLRHPKRAIDNEGGLKRFINREIFPIDSTHASDSWAILPNYGLHLLGGGITYRKDLEWFRANGYRYPTLYASLLAMTGELIQEALEKNNTTDSDPVADFYIFRPLGLLLFHSDRFAESFYRYFNPAVWPSLQGWDFVEEEFVNSGVSYVYRPPSLSFGDRRAFIYTGLTTMFGLSHTTNDGTYLSWGVGAAIREIERQREIQADVKPSMGLFYDRDNSLLWSAIYNDAGDTRLRLNYYPQLRSEYGPFGIFFNLSEEDSFAIGLAYDFVFGAAASADF